MAAGKKGALSRHRVLVAALELVDRDGLERLSMRRLAEHLGVEAMSLYRHVAHKSDLLDGVFEAVLLEMVAPERTGEWRPDVLALALGFRDALVAHPRALPLFASRPAVSPASLSAVEAGLDVLVQAGLRIEEALLVFQALVALVVGHCLAHYGPAHGAGGVDYAALDPARFAHLSRIAPVLQDYGPEDELQLGLELLLDGLAARLP